MKDNGINDISRFLGRFSYNRNKDYKAGKMGELFLQYLLPNKSKHLIDTKGMDNNYERSFRGWVDLKFLGEVRTMSFGPQDDCLEVVLGVKISLPIKIVLEYTLDKGAYSVDKNGYLIIPKQSDQEKLVAALNLVFGANIRLLRKEECDTLEKEVGDFEFLKKAQAFWTAAKNVLRIFTNTFRLFEIEGEYDEARLVVGRLSKTLKLTLAYPERRIKAEGANAPKQAETYIYTDLNMERKAVTVQPEPPVPIPVPNIIYCSKKEPK